MTTEELKTTAMRLSAPAPIATEEPDELPPMGDDQAHLDELCERWVLWVRSRRLYGPRPGITSILGQLSGKRTRPLNPGGPDAIVSAELAAFHIAYTCQPDALDKQVFDMYYVHRVKPVKSAADVLGISSRHFYRVLSDFRERVHSAAVSIQEENAAALASLPHGVNR